MHIQAFFFLAGISFLFSIYMHVNVTAWLYTSGLIYITKRLYYLSIYTLGSYALCIFTGSAFVLAKSIIPYYIFTLIAFLACVVNFYFGFQLIFNPTSFIMSLTDIWGENLNTRKLRIVERSMNCCGFLKVKENPKDNCMESKTLSCFSAIENMYMEQLKSGGFTYFAISGTFVLLIAFIMMHGIQKHSNRNKSVREMIGNA